MEVTIIENGIIVNIIIAPSLSAAQSSAPGATVRARQAGDEIGQPG